MKIGLLLTEFPNQTSISMWRVGNALRQAGHDLFVLSTRRSQDKDVCHKELEHDAKTAFYAWPPAILPSLTHIAMRPMKLFQCIKYIASLKESSLLEKIKLTPMILSGAALAKYLSDLGVQHVLVHSLANGAHLINLTRLLGGPTFSLRMGGDLEAYGKDHASKFSNALFCLPASLNNSQQLLDNQLIAKNKILTTWLGVDTEKFLPDQKFHANQTDETLKVLTIARLNHAKGHIYTLEAIKTLVESGKKIHYTIAGSGPNEATIVQFIEGNGLAENVTLLGHIDETRAVEELKKADVFVLSSIGLGEASPVSLIEAMSCGLACIATVIGGTPQIITHEQDGILVAQKNSDAIAKALLRLQKDKCYREQLGTAARNSAKAFFSCSEVAEAFTNAFMEISNNPDANLEELSPIAKKMKLLSQIEK